MKLFLLILHICCCFFARAQEIEPNVRLLYFDRFYTECKEKDAFYEREITYENEKKTIVRTYYYKGSLVKEATFKDTNFQVKHGKYLEYSKFAYHGKPNVIPESNYYPFTILRVLGNYKNDKKDGIWFLFSDSGSLFKVVVFENDKIVVQREPKDFFEKFNLNQNAIKPTKDSMQYTMENKQQDSILKKSIDKYHNDIENDIVKELRHNKDMLMRLSIAGGILKINQDRAVDF